MAKSRPFPTENQAAGISRRALLTSTAGTLAAIPLTGLPSTTEGNAPLEPPRDPRQAVSAILRVNGHDHGLSLDGRTSLLDALRDHLGLTGTKKGCDHGQCGACTVLVDGKRSLACLSFAVMMQGHAISTIEGLAGPDGRLHPMQQAFIDHDAFQCGYCTPGQIMSAVACVEEGHAGSDADIRDYMSGNLCRCAAYPNIVAAVRQGRTAMGRA